MTISWHVVGYLLYGEVISMSYHKKIMITKEVEFN